MKKPAIFSLLLAALPYLCAQTLKDEDLHVYITRTISLFATHVSDFNDLHFANIWAVYVAEDGKKGEWLTLKNGGANVVNRDRHGEFIGARDVMLDWQYALDADHRVVSYSWEWVGGSSSHSDIIQVLELRNDKVFITQQIEVDTHHGGRAVGARFDSEKKVLVAKAVDYAPFEGRCCPSLMDVVKFRWDGTQFRRISAKRIPLPKDDW